ncbi:hypothetical protein DQ04_16841000 [Trypanosoma grayi]|uniref:hypothetical protein n=1 Tax=Trypanosoma grayi TaxID=71804 RepID=UPI0004F44153|nr:hypothetical protein DQ04_16841000 [Trypanosoma grayi]KEG05980.1 hypothetical protein DQ04_16841000 [Trypanosoma grayi]
MRGILSSSGLLCFLTCLLAAVGVAAFQAEPRSIAQACRGELQTECVEKRADCIVEHLDEVNNAVCRAWIEARTACVEYVRLHRGCNNGNHRTCIRATPKEELPPLCFKSAYYTSLFRHLPRRLH